MPTLKATAEHLDLSTERVRQLRALGVIPDPRQSDLDTLRVRYLRHLRAQAAGRGSRDGTLDLAEERARLAQLQQQKVEMDLAERRGQLIDVRDLMPHSTRTIATLKNTLQGVPSRIRQQCPHLEPADVVLMQDLVDQALNEAADGLLAMIGQHPEPAAEPVPDEAA